MALLLAPLSALLLACATKPDGGEGGRIEYRYPPDALLQIGADPEKPTLAQLQGPEGDQYVAKYILALELSGMTRGQALRCLQVWKATQQAIDAGTLPSDAPPAYCIFEELTK